MICKDGKLKYWGKPTKITNFPIFPRNWTITTPFSVFNKDKHYKKERPIHFTEVFYRAGKGGGGGMYIRISIGPTNIR